MLEDVILCDYNEISYKYKKTELLSICERNQNNLVYHSFFHSLFIIFSHLWLNEILYLCSEFD